MNGRGEKINKKEWRVEMEQPSWIEEKK